MLNNFLFIGTLLAVWILMILWFLEKKKQKKEHQKALERLNQKTDAMEHKLLHVEFRLKRAEVLERDIDEELLKTKKHTSFINSAVRVKVRKEKKKPKRRKRSA